MSLTSRVARRLPAPVLSAVVHRDLHLPPGRRRDDRSVALVYGNCQAEALRRILAAHPSFVEHYRLLRVPAVHEITARELRGIQRWLPKVDLLIGQQVKPDYRGMALGLDQLADRLPASAQVLRYPVAYFEGLFPFQVYVQRSGEPLATGVPITDYHDLRHLYAASRGWDVPTTLRRLDDLELDPDWLRENAERSVEELARREAQHEAKLAGLIRQHPTSSFRTINHPVNRLVTEVARQLLGHLGFADADRVLGYRQTYLDHTQAPFEPQVVRALGGEAAAEEQGQWITPAGVFSRADVVEAHLAYYAADPGLLTDGLRKHARRLRKLDLMWRSGRSARDSLATRTP